MDLNFSNPGLWKYLSTLCGQVSFGPFDVLFKDCSDTLFIIHLDEQDESVLVCIWSQRGMSLLDLGLAIQFLKEDQEQP